MTMDCCACRGRRWNKLVHSGACGKLKEQDDKLVHSGACVTLKVQDSRNLGTFFAKPCNSLLSTNIG